MERGARPLRRARWEHGVGAPDAEIVGTRDVDGVVRPFVSWTGLLPLYAGIPSAERARRMVEVVLRPEGFWGPVGVRTCPADDLYFQQSPRVLLFDFKKGAAARCPTGAARSGCSPATTWPRGSPGTASPPRRARWRSRRRGSWPDDLAPHRRAARVLERRGVGLWPRSGTFVCWNVLGPWLLDRHA